MNEVKQNTAVTAVSASDVRHSIKIATGTSHNVMHLTFPREQPKFYRRYIILLLNWLFGSSKMGGMYNYERSLFIKVYLTKHNG